MKALSTLVLIGVLGLLVCQQQAQAKSKHLLLGAVAGAAVTYALTRPSTPQQPVPVVPPQTLHSNIMCYSPNGSQCTNTKGERISVYQYAGRAGFKYVYQFFTKENQGSGYTITIIVGN